MAFVQPPILTPTLIVMDASANESNKIKYSEDVEYDKISVLEAKVRVIKGIDLYDPIQVVEMCFCSKYGPT
ncbi:hypothetical protein Peur_023943 [Populus x canadensis]